MYPPSEITFFFVTGLLKWKAMGFHGCQDAMIIPEKFQPGFFGGSPQKSCKDNKSQQASDGFFSDTYKLSSWTYLYNETNMAGIGQRLAPKFEPFWTTKIHLRLYLVGGSKYFLFSPLFGEDSHFD